MRYQTPKNEILQVRKAGEVLGGMEPLLSSAKSDWDGLLIESYRIHKLGPTPRFSYSNRHVISIQREGLVEAHENNSTSELYPGSIAICPANVPQSSFTFSDAKMSVAMLDPAFVRRALGNVINVDAMEIMPQLPVRDEQLNRLVLAAEIEVASGLASGRLFLESLGTALAAHLLTHHATRRTALKVHGTAMPRYLLRRAIDFINEGLGSDMSLIAIAACVDMSPYHFCRLFKRSTGLSPLQYVRRERIHRAQQLIAEHQLSLAEIADELGFSDQSHFTRTFRGILGVTPSQYSACV
jgi:AraC family transcriptional regulator